MTNPVLSVVCLAASDLTDAEALTRTVISSMPNLKQHERDELLLHIINNYKCCVERTEHLFLKAVLEGELVGIILVKQFWNLAELYVSVAHQGQGIGKSLLHEALKICRIHSERTFVRLNSSTQAVAFYKNYGFTDIILKEAPPYACVPLIYYF